MIVALSNKNLLLSRYFSSMFFILSFLWILIDKTIFDRSKYFLRSKFPLLLNLHRCPSNCRGKCPCPMGASAACPIPFYLLTLLSL